MLVNPPEPPASIDQTALDSLWEKAKDLQPTLQREEFDRAVYQFYAQHHELPKELIMADVPGLSCRVASIVGDMPGILYEAPKYSRKSVNGDKYVHPTNDTHLYCSPEGLFFVVSKNLRLDDDGWLHD